MLAKAGVDAALARLRRALAARRRRRRARSPAPALPPSAAAQQLLGQARRLSLPRLPTGRPPTATSAVIPCRAVKAAIEDMSAKRSTSRATDGCSIPTYAVSLFARLRSASRDLGPDAGFDARAAKTPREPHPRWPSPSIRSSSRERGGSTPKR